MNESLKQLCLQMAPEILLLLGSCFLLLLGTNKSEFARRFAPVFALIAIGGAGIVEATRLDASFTDAWGQIVLNPLAHYFRLISMVIGIPLVLLTWPTNRDATAGKSIDFGDDVPEFFALMLMSLAGILLVAGANDIILLFLGIELASIPTYVMVSISRPIPVAQEAGVKYFFLGAMAAALMLFGLSYLYGTSGSIRLNEIAAAFRSTLPNPTPWQTLAVVIAIGGFAFKLAAFPLHEYAADVYQGAATPVTAFLAFVPKTTGFIALLKILWTAGGESWAVPHNIATLIAVIAVLTMSIGNVLGLLQNNVKRVLAYSSVAHTGYMLVGVSALLYTDDGIYQQHALAGVLFYLATYGITNAGAFGVLMLLPAARPQPGSSAETFDDLAGTGRKHVALGLAMAVCCFSLTGIPLTAGFLGKFLLIKPALETQHLNWLVIALMINAAISAAYYLRIVGTMFLRTDSIADTSPTPMEPMDVPAPLGLAIGLSVLATLTIGFYAGGAALNNAAIRATPVSLPPMAAMRSASAGEGFQGR